MALNSSIVYFIRFVVLRPQKQVNIYTEMGLRNYSILLGVWIQNVVRDF